MKRITTTTNEYTKWVAMWGNAMSITEPRPENYSKNITLRYPVYAPFDGSALRFTFDNFCGPENITITKAFVAVSAGEHHRYIHPHTSKAITFQGNSSLTLEAGAQAVSDAIDFPVKAGSFITISFYLADFTNMTSGVNVTGPLSKGYYGIGDLCLTERFPKEISKSTNWFYFLSTIDILTEETNRAIICYGDSITAQSWPDYLALRLEKEGYTHTSVIRRAVSGTRVLRQYGCITYQSYGLKGDIRFPHETAAVAGADTVIIQQGINDIIHPVGLDVNAFRPMSDLPTAEQLADGLTWYLEKSGEYGLTPYLGTLLPIYGWRTYASFREDLKNAVNDWMRSTDLAAGTIDFDAALRDETFHERFREGFDSGDHLHPSAAAYEAMAYAVPEKLLC